MNRFTGYLQMAWVFHRFLACEISYHLVALESSQKHFSHGQENFKDHIYQVLEMDKCFFATGCV